MAFLYGEAAPERKRELDAHLAQCGLCAERVAEWRAGMAALDTWTLPARRRAPLRLPVPLLKWAAAAALVLGVGFALGRQASPAAGEVTALRATVTQLAAAMERERATTASNAVAAAAAVANAETIRLLSEYASMSENRRTEDHQAVALAFRTVESRLARLRAELETVAVNTEDGLVRTHASLAHLASLAAADPVKPDPLP